MQKISILFLTNAYPDFDSSYRGIFVKKMASLLQKDKYEISVVTPRIYKRSRYSEDQNGIKIYRFPFFSGNRLLIEYRRIPYLRMLIYYITGFFSTFYILMKHRCRLIHVHWAIPTGLIGVLIGAVLRKPVVVTIHGSDFRLAMGQSFLLKKVFLWVCKKARYLHCVSEVMRREIETLGIEKEKISTFPMGVDEAFFEKGRNRKRGLDAPSFTVVSNRNLLPIYNLSLLIRAIPMVLKEEPEVKFIIAGEGPERQNLENEVKDLKISSHVQFVGQIPHGEMPNLLSRANVYISTSLYDGTSISLLEAMACGVFPIVTEIPSNQEWITDDQNGFLISINNENHLARKIVEAFRRPALLTEAGQKNQKMVEERGHWKRTIREITGIYEGLSAVDGYMVL
jgi:glycosyltransferase involved in cell wall biosynthesis